MQAAKWLRAVLGACALAALSPALCAGQPLVFIAPTNHAPPIARFEQGQLVGGLLRGVGDALARELGREAAYLSLPAKRAPQGLAEGAGELMCYALPDWVPAGFRWSMPFMPNALVLVSRAGAAAPVSIEAMADLRVGTVLGYHYRPIEARLGQRFLREDAVDMQANLRKLAAGRLEHVLTERLVFRQFQREHRELALREGLEILSYRASCALSPQSKLRVDELDAAIRRLQRSGRLDSLLEAALGS